MQRDLKSENIMMSDVDGSGGMRALAGDLGAARVTHEAS